MKTTIGIVLLVGGVLLLVFGYQAAESVEGRVRGVFTATNKNKTTWMYIGGTAMCVAGVFQLYSGKK
jgi:uncharacterized membrane protein YidH (DUF202 family)